MSDNDMVRVSVSLSAEAVAQIDAWAAAAGLKRGQFASVALMIGSRTLARQMTPEDYLTPEVWRTLAGSMGVDPAQLQAALAARKA